MSKLCQNRFKHFRRTKRLLFKSFTYPRLAPVTTTTTLRDSRALAAAVPAPTADSFDPSAALPPPSTPTMNALRPVTRLTSIFSSLGSEQKKEPKKSRRCSLRILIGAPHSGTFRALVRLFRMAAMMGRLGLRAAGLQPGFGGLRIAANTGRNSVLRYHGPRSCPVLSSLLRRQ